MAHAWIEREGPSGPLRRELLHGLTRIGGPNAHVEVAGAGDDELQLWDDPPKLVHLGDDEHPTVNGRLCAEAALAHGDVIAWRGARFVFRTVEKRAELALEEDAPATKPAVVASKSTARAARREPTRSPRPSAAADTFWRLMFALALLAAVASVLIWARARNGLSVDAWIDRVLERFARDP
ncbi:MAG: hypothetical protein K8S98_12180 [Planctomycetes bacterium]|nr:hypothetical protein [Planctomycetota bacterium]